MIAHPADFLPAPERSALLVIDVQERLAAAMPPEECAQVIRNTLILVEAAKEFGLPLAASEQYPKGLGPTVAEIRAALPAEAAPRPKLAFSCCGEAVFNDLWQAWTGRDVLIAGIEAHVCVLQTALDLLAQGRRVYLAADAVCSRARHNKQLALDLLRQAGVVIGSTEMFVFAMQRAAGSERFKRISKLVK